MRPATLAHLLLLGVVLIWGATFVLIKGALADVSPLLFVLIRMSIAAAVLALVYRRTMRRLTWPALRAGTLVGVCLGAGYAFQTSGLRLTTASKSGFLTGLVVVLVPILSLVPALRAPGAHRPRWQAGLGAGLAFAGLLFLTLPAGEPLRAGTLRLGTLLSGFGPGEVLTLACALAYAFHMLALAHAAPRLPYRQLAVVQIAVAALTTAIAMPFFEPHPFLHLSPIVAAALAIAALLATAAAFTIQSWVQQFLPATDTALILTLEPVFACLASFLFLHERLGLRAAAGAGLILCGIAITELWPESIQPTAHEAAPLL